MLREEETTHLEEKKAQRAKLFAEEEKCTGKKEREKGSNEGERKTNKPAICRSGRKVLNRREKKEKVSPQTRMGE